jgi:hypothetical protein
MTPWATGRQAIYVYLREREAQVRSGDVYRLPNDPVRDLYKLPFGEMIQRTELFAADVAPAVEDSADEAAVTAAVPELLAKVIESSDGAAEIALYQILISDLCYTIETVLSIGRVLQHRGILADRRAYAYFVKLAFWAPDDAPVRFAVHMLAFTKKAPPLELLRILGLHVQFAAAVIPTIRARFRDTEDTLIDIARLHDGFIRLEAIEALRSVKKKANRNWLLREAHKSEEAKIHLVYWAAVRGDLVGRLRLKHLEIDELHDLAAILGELAVPSGASGAKDMEDYEEGPEACYWLFEHCVARGPDLFLEPNVAQIVKWAKTAQLEGSSGRSGAWGTMVREEIASKGTAYLDKAGWQPNLANIADSPDVKETPTVDWLEEGDVNRFREVLDHSLASGDLTRIADWAERMLYLNMPEPERTERRERLEGLDMPGYTDPNLKSIYGQLLLQMLKALEEAPGLGWRLIQAGLRSESKLLRGVAARTLEKWDDVSMGPEVFTELLVARRNCDGDGEMREIIEKLMLREPAGGGVV